MYLLTMGNGTYRLTADEVINLVGYAAKVAYTLTNPMTLVTVRVRNGRILTAAQAHQVGAY